jgi:phage recombination protein Bet
MTTALEESKKLPAPVAKRGIDEAQWRTLCNSLYPGANPQSVLLLIDYCRARGLDPLKRPAHIVPMEVKDAKTGTYTWRDVILPGIYELRTTAMRTSKYCGHSTPEYGPAVTVYGVTAPEWCAITFYRLHPLVGEPAIPFPIRVYFREVCATTKDKNSKDLKANARRAPVQMLTKCAEAAGLREAFPDELGGEQTAEELDGQRAADVDVTDTLTVQPAPDGFEAWWGDLQATAQEHDLGKLEDAYAKSDPALRQFVAQSAAYRAGWEALKAQAAASDEPVEGEVD